MTVLKLSLENVIYPTKYPKKALNNTLTIIQKKPTKHQKYCQIMIMNDLELDKVIGSVVMLYYQKLAQI
ncbi:MAG: hypothetical protein COA79_19995 [Planctomycetota bacterium]|nr:MAG: hypothetical protein COA79_19995 [Planctomycetota bacterium]